MPHLVSPVSRRTPVQDVRVWLVEAHFFLASAAASTAKDLAYLSASAQWGCSAKRVRVSLPEKRVELVQYAERDHSLTEIINQCATLERLIGALDWAQREVPGFEVIVCHPTTSSDSTSEADDNDLVLENRDGDRCRFEISDVASSTKDGNQKEVKDLASLGIIASKSRPVRAASQWPQGRSFLVVSAEFCTYLMSPTRHVLKAGEVRYHETGRSGTTRIVEVLPGKGVGV